MPLDSELHKAAHKGDLETCKMLIEGSVDEEVPMTVNDAGASDRRPLHRAAGAGHLALCIYFLDIGAEIDAVSNYLAHQVFLFAHHYPIFCAHRSTKAGGLPFIGQQLVEIRR